MLCFLSERLNLKKVYWDFDTNFNTHALLWNVTHLISFKPWSNKNVVFTQQDYYDVVPYYTVSALVPTLK